MGCSYSSRVNDVMRSKARSRTHFYIICIKPAAFTRRLLSFNFTLGAFFCALGLWKMNTADGQQQAVRAPLRMDRPTFVMLCLNSDADMTWWGRRPCCLQVLINVNGQFLRFYFITSCYLSRTYRQASVFKAFVYLKINAVERITLRAHSNIFKAPQPCRTWCEPGIMELWLITH